MQEFVAANASHSIISLLVASFIGLLQVQWQSSKEVQSIVDAHPTKTRIFFISIFTYCLSIKAKIKLRTHYLRYSQMCGHVSHISVSVSAASLASILLPHLQGQLIVSTWAFSFVVVECDLFKFIYPWFCQRIIKVSRQLYGLLNRFLWCNLDQEDLPL